MIKKLIVAAGFAGSMLIGVPAASANSPAICMAQYEATMAHCSYIDEDGVGTNCSQAASIAFQQCLERLVTIHE